MILNKDNKSGFIWIPKSAGHSISDILLNNGYSFWYEPGTVSHIHAQPLSSYHHYFKDHFIFCIVRNPWDRLLSLYSYLIQKQKNLSDAVVNFNEDDWTNGFNHWLLNCQTQFKIDSKYKNMSMQKRQQVEYFQDVDGNNLVDYIGKIENINHDFKVIADRLNIPNTLAVLNTSTHSHYRDVYTQESRDFVAKHFCNDIEMFGYLY